MNPCYELCFLRYNQQYSEKCDTSCEYAMTIKDLEKFKNFKEFLDEKYREGVIYFQDIYEEALKILEDN